MKKLVAVSFAIAVSGTSGCAAPLDPGDDVRETSDALAGTTVLEDGEPAVVAILSENAAGQTTICTGELIAPRVVLTAAHCVVGRVSSSVLVGPSIEDVREEANVLEHVPHPSYRPWNGATPPRSDIGVVVLAKPLRTKPIAIRRTPLSGSDEGRPVTLVGYGATVRTDATTAGRKRSGVARITDVAAREIFVAGGPGRASGCGGDSGGPALLRTARGTEVIAVESWGDDACKAGTTKTRVDAHLPFLDGVLARVR